MLRRARPLLGTIVDITIHDSSVYAGAAMEHAFSRVEQIHKRLSFHSPDSELSMLNRANPDDEILSSPDLFNVICCCLQISRKTDGTFNPAALKGAVQIGRSAFNNAGVPYKADPLHQSLQIAENNKIIIRQKVSLDLGGIAKGYAVDQACSILAEYGIKNALVNAGGDIRAIGTNSHLIRIRHPDMPGQTASTLSLSNAAIATSSAYFNQQASDSQRVSLIFDGRNGMLCNACESISIKAKSCMLADALTKVAFSLEENAMEEILAYFDAEMFVTVSRTLPKASGAINMDSDISSLQILAG